MARPAFVGRDDQLQRLLDVVEHSGEGGPGVVLIEGDPGIGKSSLVGALERAVAENPALAMTRFVTGHCSRETGPQDAYSPFIEIMARLDDTTGEKTGRRSGLARVVKEVAPDWVRIIPGVGPLFSTSAKTAMLVAGVLNDGKPADRSETVLRHHAEAILREARPDRPLAVVIEDVHWIDHASSTLLGLLATQADGVKLTIVLTARPDESGPDHPWRRLRAELVALGRFQVLHLEGLDEREMRDYLQRRYRTTFSPDFPDWLIDTYQGHPLFIAEYLELLEREGIITKDAAGAHLDGTVEHDRTGWRATGRLAAEVRISGDTEVLLDRRIERLLDDEREVLQVGAVQGLRFDSLVLAQLTARKELAVLAELRRVLDRDHIVEVVSGEDWMRDRSETYAFEHELMRQAFYRRLGRRELILYHREIGAVLGGLASEFEVPPRQLLIAIAYHLDRGGDHAAAAAAYLRAAHASYEEGASIEAMDLCRSGLATLGVGPARPVGHEALVAETVLLLLVCGLFGPSDHALNAELLGAAADGERAAHTADLKSLLAQILAIRGRLLVRIGNVPEAIAVMRQAVALAKETGDPLTEFIATTQLGSELAKEDLAESLIVRHAANEIFEARLRSAELPSAEHELLLRQHGSLLVLIGLGEFDRGDIGRAIGWLERGVQELRERAMFDESMAALNFLAQVLTSLGLFAPARDHLEESLRIHDTHHRDRANPWVGYNLALLAHVLFETGDVESAVETMAQAVQASEASEHIDLLTHVLIYQAQLLIEPGNSHGDLEEAWQVLNKNNELSESAGLRWSETMGASLMGQVLLRRGALDGAQTHSARALAEIDAHGDLPAVRTEEILFNHWLVLEALARHEEAARILDRAWEVVQRKLGSLTQDEHRVAFLREVRLNRLIAEAHEARAAEWRAGP